ncbi:MAG TPA: hypothetical protein VD840_03765 [Sinorhizobium sp.]|nr:hypothetical protein [Sinorhizobium sp.]
MKNDTMTRDGGAIWQDAIMVCQMMACAISVAMLPIATRRARILAMSVSDKARTARHGEPARKLSHWPSRHAPKLPFRGKRRNAEPEAQVGALTEARTDGIAF